MPDNRPRGALTFVPQPDITAGELAEIIRWFDVWCTPARHAALSEGAQRHFSAPEERRGGPIRPTSAG